MTRAQNILKVERELKLQADRLGDAAFGTQGREEFEATHDEVDLANTVVSQESGFMLSQQASKELARVQDALERLKNGNYGICESCDDPIPAKRLKAQPHATLCIQCQSELEHDERRFVERIA
jgi:DnaK suppressor protein